MQNEQSESAEMRKIRERIRELVEATLIIGARRGAGVGVLDYDAAKKLIERHIDDMTDEVFNAFPEISPAPRPAVIWFADKMEAKLKANDHKGYWGKCELQYLSMRLTQERKELYDAIESKDSDRIISECADVANFSMMIADRFGNNYGK